VRSVFRRVITIGLVGGLCSFVSAGNVTMIGTISDSACGASHAKVIHRDKREKITDRECTLACVKYGRKFVFVSDGKVYSVANQNFGALTEHAGESVILTGNVYGTTITVSKIAPAGKNR
jgi:hypothetical protein